MADRAGKCDNRVTFVRGGSRIPRRRGRQPSGGRGLWGWGAPTYDFAKFSKKLHEIEKIVGHRGASPLDPRLFVVTFSSSSEKECDDKSKSSSD